jgi:hypothetical protein
MIYQHYKGGIYFLIGSAHPIGNFKNVEHVESVYMANLITEDGFVEAPVATIKDLRTDYQCYVIQSKQAIGTYILYRGLNGQLWLRQKSDFYAMLNDGTPRFKPLKAAEIFALMSQNTVVEN